MNRMFHLFIEFVCCTDIYNFAGDYEYCITLFIRMGDSVV